MASYLVKHTIINMMYEFLYIWAAWRSEQIPKELMAAAAAQQAQ